LATRSFQIEAKSDVIAHTGPTKSGISTYPPPHLGKSQFISGQFSDQYQVLPRVLRYKLGVDRYQGQQRPEQWNSAEAKQLWRFLSPDPRLVYTVITYCYL